MANIISDETIEYVGILAKLELNEEENILRVTRINSYRHTHGGKDHGDI